MNSSAATIEAPFLKNTQSPTIVTHTEYLSKNSLVMARYRFELNDAVTLFVEVDGVIRNEQTNHVSPGGVARGEVGFRIEDTHYWDVLGCDLDAYFTVNRSSDLPGRSDVLRFEILAK
jgi:hypothetical protein